MSPVYEPEPDDEDTGPVRIEAAESDDWNRQPAQGTWAGRFDAPLTVSPRQTRRRQANPKLLYAIGAGVAVVAVAALAYVFLRPSPDGGDAPSAAPQPSASQAPDTPSVGEQRLLTTLPRGYAADACAPADSSNDDVARINCAKNTDVGGPETATYTLAADKADLDEIFDGIVRSAERVNCPGNIQSPGPWRRNAAPDKVAGTLFCGVKQGRPTVAWTDDVRLVVSEVRAGASGPALPVLYAWWASHS